MVPVKQKQVFASTEIHRRLKIDKLEILAVPDTNS